MRRRHRAAHRMIWVVLAVALPLVLFGSLVARRNGPNEAPAIQLSAPPQ